MTVLVKCQVDIEIFTELHGNRKLSMTSNPPSPDWHGTIFTNTGIFLLYQQGCKFSGLHEVQILTLLIIFSPFWRLLAQIHTLFQAVFFRSVYIFVHPCIRIDLIRLIYVVWNKLVTFLAGKLYN